MPDYEIRLFRADGSLALVHVSHQENDDLACSTARGLQGDHASFEVRRDGARIDCVPWD